MADRAIMRGQRTKLSLADIGAPQILMSQPENIRFYVMGAILGRATRFCESTSPDKSQTFEGLVGEFRMIPSDPSREELESTKLYLPEAFHNLIGDQLRKVMVSDKNPGGDPNALIEFAMEAVVIRAKNPVGYSWEMRPMIQSDVVNPLDALYKKIDAKKIKALEDHRTK
jgi:hypothetical protein